jgi:predicted site-specific integrase-resolvase
MAVQLRYKISEAAKMLGMSVWTLRRWVYSGKAPSIKTETGTVFIPAPWVHEQGGLVPPSTHLRCAIYARESSSENKICSADNATNDSMEYLIAILRSFAARLYGQPRGRRKTKAAIKALKEAE